MGRVKKKKTKAFLLPPLHVQGKKKEEQCRSKRHRSGLLFFFMKWRRFGQNAPFHLNRTSAQNATIFKSALHYLLFISIASLTTSISTLKLAAFFTSVLGLGFMQLSPQLINKPLISSIRPLNQFNTAPSIFAPFPNWSLVSDFRN